MKKTFFFAVVLFLAFTAVVFASRTEIDEALNSYEAIVVEAENLAQMLLVDPANFSALDEKATAAGTKITAVANEREWMIQDAKRSAALRLRFNAAMATVIQKLLKY
ncbi:MAG: hypothetical protein LBH44_02315 [Treponema sp.]|jgi:hypothetical protein|nr:hypothetical protein [Treponema sp.]